MLTGLPRLLGRGFLIGFVLPATVFMLALKVVDVGFDIRALDVPKDADVLGIVIIPFVILFLAILLLALNRPIVRTLEGYGRLNPFRPLLSYRQRIFTEKIQPVLDEKKRLDEARKTDAGVQSGMLHFSKRLSEAVQFYPDESEYVLPTRFGNVMRAFEVYSRVVYGLESVQGWNWLQLILPKQVAEQVRDSRAMLDFIVSILALSVAIFIMYATAAWRAHALSVKVIPLAAALSVALAWSYLPTAAIQWGETVKSVFDMQRHRLARDLGLEVPLDPTEETKMWRDVSLMMMYRSSGAFNSLSKYRKKKRRAQKNAEFVGELADRSETRPATDRSEKPRRAAAQADPASGDGIRRQALGCASFRNHFLFSRSDCRRGVPSTMSSDGPSKRRWRFACTSRKRRFEIIDHLQIAKSNSVTA